MGFKFKKGSKVEVWNNLERPLGSWCYAEIVSGNGRYYYVRYDPCPSDIGASMERVPRKAIRPCPPDKRRKSWVPGNRVEVFDNSSWKPAEVASVVGGNYYLVRLLGSFREFRVHSSALRLQQSWQNDKWVVVEKDLEKSLGYNHFSTKNDDGFKELSWDLSRGMKRKLRAVETCTEARKLRAVEKDGRCQRPVEWHAPKVREKVDAVASPQTMLGEKYMHASLNSRTVFSEKATGRKIPNPDDEGFLVPSLERSDIESTFSSVGSCSINDSPCRLAQPLNCPTEHLGCDDTSFVSGSEPSLPMKEALAAEIHQLELHAYRTTLVALHASGPISWEQEALMTNLRLMLHISTDEQLLELRNLISVETVVPFR